MRDGHQTTSNNPNYDAGIVLIDLHQLNVKNNFFRQYKSATLNTGQPHVNEEQNPQNNNPHIRFPNQMIEQINIALEQKRVREFSAWVIEACCLYQCLEREQHHSSDEE